MNIETRIALFVQTTQSNGLMPKAIRSYDDRYVQQMIKDYQRYLGRIANLSDVEPGVIITLAECKQIALEEFIIRALKDDKTILRRE